MPDVIVLMLAASGTALATGLGAIPVFFLGHSCGAVDPAPPRLCRRSDGVASIAGLLIPAAEEGSALAVVALGAALMLALSLALGV